MAEQDRFPAELTCDNAGVANRAHDRAMPELLAKANRAILECQRLRREGLSLRLRAAVLASQLGQTIVQAQQVASEADGPSPTRDQGTSSP